MYSKILSASALVLASTSLVSAQTFSACTPVKGDKCPADPAFGGTVTVDFTKGESDVFELAGGTKLDYDPSKGAVFSISSDGNAPTITSKKYIFFGRVEIQVQAAFGAGIVTSAVLQSDCLDEIDWEWLGGDSKQVQTNYFAKGDTTTYDRGGFSAVSNPQTEFHTYTIDWTPEHVQWIIDGNVVRTLAYADAKGGSNFPQTPMQIKLGTWVAGRQGAPEGTVTWAGGYADYSKGPFIGYYKSITITDYSNGAKGAKSYSYGDSSGTFGSIKISNDPNSIAATNGTSTVSSSTRVASSTLSTATSGPYPTGSGSNSSDSTPTGSDNKPTTTPATKTPNAGIKSAVNFVAMGAALALGFLVL